ncbi:MAG: VanZ family protein [Actinomycetota bacterium]|nr:VanZ family protein [Actinomycetota bacterium]
MDYLALYACELVCTAVPAFIAYLVLRKLASNRANLAVPPGALAALFAAYLFTLMHFTGVGTLHDALRFGLDFNPHQMNLTPFANFTEDVEGHLLNILLFVPLGLLVPMLSGSRLRALPITATAIATSLVIEFSQLLNSRVTDADDLLMNVIGALIGYGVFRLIDKKRKKRSDQTSWMIIVAAMIAAAFLGRFLLYDEMGLAKMLFGF